MANKQFGKEIKGKLLIFEAEAGLANFG